MTKAIGKEKASEKLSDIMTLNNGPAAHLLRSWPYAGHGFAEEVSYMRAAPGNGLSAVPAAREALGDTLFAVSTRRGKK